MSPKRPSSRQSPPAQPKTATGRSITQTPVTGATPRELLSRAKLTSTAERVREVASHLPPAQPGSRNRALDTQSDYSVTARIERPPSEMTPEPLPPSPAASQAEMWFDQVPTNPAAAPNIDVLIGSRPDLAAALRGEPSTQSQSDPSQTGRDSWTPPPYAERPPARATPLLGRPWMMPLLLSVTALAVGMVLGALLFGGSKGSESEKATAADCAEASELNRANSDETTKPSEAVEAEAVEAEAVEAAAKTKRKRKATRKRKK